MDQGGDLLLISFKIEMIIRFHGGLGNCKGNKIGKLRNWL